MIIKGNSVGYPLPDPSNGLEMQGGINMNGQAVKGLNAPTADDEAANKGYVDVNKVDKSRIVNNFVTTEAGFVADARALKVLNDSIAYTPTTHDSGESNFINIDFNNYQDGVYEIVSISSYAMVIKSRGYINLGPVAAYTNSGLPTMTAGVLKFNVGGFYSEAYIRRKF